MECTAHVTTESYQSFSLKNDSQPVREEASVYVKIDVMDVYQNLCSKMLLRPQTYQSEMRCVLVEVTGERGESQEDLTVNIC